MHGAIVDVLKRSYASLWRFSDTGGQFDDRRSLPAPRADIVQLELTVPLETLGSPLLALVAVLAIFVLLESHTGNLLRAG
jgi:hypothetical protein